jgi:hypothetical protein
MWLTLYVSLFLVIVASGREGQETNNLEPLFVPEPFSPVGMSDLQVRHPDRVEEDDARFSSPPLLQLWLWATIFDLPEHEIEPAGFGHPTKNPAYAGVFCCFQFSDI